MHIKSQTGVVYCELEMGKIGNGRASLETLAGGGNEGLDCFEVIRVEKK